MQAGRWVLINWAGRIVYICVEGSVLVQRMLDRLAGICPNGILPEWQWGQFNGMAMEIPMTPLSLSKKNRGVEQKRTCISRGVKKGICYL